MNSSENTIHTVDVGEQKSYTNGHLKKYLIISFVFMIIVLGSFFFIFKEKFNRDYAHDQLAERLKALDEYQKQQKPLTEKETTERLQALDTYQKEQKILTEIELAERIKTLEAYNLNEK